MCNLLAEPNQQSPVLSANAQHAIAGGVQAEFIPMIWNEVKPLLELVDQREFSMPDIYQLLMSRDMQLWCVSDGQHRLLGAVVTELVFWPRFRAVRLFLGAGRQAIRWVQPLSEVVIPWARHYGCTHWEVVGRPGWDRLIRRALKKPLVAERIVYRGEF